MDFWIDGLMERCHGVGESLMSVKIMNEAGIILYLVTKNYAAMRQFFVDLGLDVKSEAPGWGQVTPLLNKGRGCMIFHPSLLISLEESTDVPPSGPLYMQIEGIAKWRLDELKSRYSVKYVEGGLYGGCFYSIVPPDGGIVNAVPSQD